MKQTVVVLADACRTSGALTIYKQFVGWLRNYADRARWVVFVDPTMPQPWMSGVEYVENCDHSWLGKFRLTHNGYQRMIDAMGIKSSVIVSLENVGMRTSLPQIIYYHQALSLSDYRWNPFRRSERKYWIYKHMYMPLVKYSTNEQTDFVVQIPCIKERLARRLGISGSRVHTMFPDVEQIDVNSVKEWVYEDDTFNFLFPAGGDLYKNHLLLVKAVKLLKQADPELAEKIRIHFTIAKDYSQSLSRKIKEYGLDRNFVFHSVIPHDELLRYYKASSGLLFPSEIESLGLPLIEAAFWGKPIVASDLDYAHQVLGDYPGVTYASPKHPEEWAQKIQKVCLASKTVQPLSQSASTWPAIFDLILHRAKIATNEGG